jgi:carbon monoxide dehydrogenase subunit G
MQFDLATEIPSAPESIWPVLLDVRRIAACIPGCERVEELAPLAHYKALMKQKVGPFRVEVPAEIFVEELTAPQRVRARATGRDKYTGTSFSVTLAVNLTAVDGGRSTLSVGAELTVAGRLAALGYAVIRKRAEETFAEFNQRLNAEIVA